MSRCISLLVLRILLPLHLDLPIHVQIEICIKIEVDSQAVLSAIITRQNKEKVNITCLWLLTEKL